MRQVAEPGFQIVVERDRTSRAVDHAQLQVVFEVLPDLSALALNGDAVLRELRFRADTAEHEQLRRADRTGRQHDLAGGVGCAGCAVLQVLHADGSAVFDDELLGFAAGFDLESRAARHAAEVALGGTATSALVRREVEITHTLLGCAIDVVVARHTDVGGRIDEGVADFPLEGHIRYVDRAPDAVVFTRAVSVVFGLLEERQHIVIRPWSRSVS